MKLEFDFNDQLRAVPRDIEQFNQRVSELTERLNEENPVERMRVQGELAVYLRMQGKLSAAENLLLDALKIIEEENLGIKFEVQQKIRLGHVLQFKREFSKSNELFSEIIELCEKKDELKGYLAFAWQHAGKNSFDQGRYRDALSCFERALDIRQLQNAPKDQIDSTLFAIQVTKGLL